MRYKDGHGARGATPGFETRAAVPSSPRWSRLLFVYFVVAHLVGLLAVRCAFMAAEQASGQPFCGGENIVLIGSGPHVERVARALEHEAAGGFA